VTDRNDAKVRVQTSLLLSEFRTVRPLPLFLGPYGTLIEYQGSLDLVSDYGAQRARFKAYVHRKRKGSNPTTNLYLNLIRFLPSTFFSPHMIPSTFRTLRAEVQDHV